MIYLDRSWDITVALAPVLGFIVLALGVVSLAFNGCIGGWILLDQIKLRRRARATGCTVDELMDSDDWAKSNGYLDEQTEDWLFEAPEFATASPERAEAVLFAASVMADIDDLPGGDAA